MKRFTCFLMTAAVIAAQPYTDRPLETDSDSYQRIVGAFELRARATFKAAKERYRSGLPPRFRFYVSTRLTNPGVAIEDVFVSVTSANDTSVSGVIDSEPTGKVAFKRLDPIHVSDENITNWTILRPDGKEEGNYVGKAIDAYRSVEIGVLFEVKREGKELRVRFVDARDKQNQSLRDIISEEVITQGERMMREIYMNKDPAATEKAPFTFLIYDFRKSKYVGPQHP